MRTYNFISEFTYELPDNTLTITATGKMWPGRAATREEPEEGPEIHGEPDILITGENGVPIAFDDFPESKQDIIWKMIYDHHEEVGNED